MNHGPMYYTGRLRQLDPALPRYAVFRCDQCGREVGYCLSPLKVSVLELGTEPTATHSVSIPPYLFSEWGIEMPADLEGITPPMVEMSGEIEAGT